MLLQKTVSCSSACLMDAKMCTHSEVIVSRDSLTQEVEGVSTNRYIVYIYIAGLRALGSGV